MLVLRRTSGFGLTEFLTVTVVVAVVVSLAMMYCVHKWSAAEGAGVSISAPQRASAAGSTSLQSDVLPWQADMPTNL